jgi:hypothetical protein
MRYVITSGTSVRGHVDQRDGAKAALEHVWALIKQRRPNVLVFDEDRRELTLNDLRRRAAQESKAATR